MITSKNRITRRTLLTGAGGIAIGLPFLSAMLKPGRSHAQTTAPQRFLVFYSSGGTVLDKWRPVGTPDNFMFQDMLSPLNPFKQKLVVLDGLDLDITSIGTGHPHSRGMAGVLTGRKLLPGALNTNGGNASFADGISIDQAIAGTVSAGLRFKSLEVSSGWSSGIAAGGMPHPANIINTAGSQLPIPPATDPWATFQRVFGGTGGTPSDNANQANFTRSILDSVAQDYSSLAGRLGGEDRAKLEAHLAMIRELEAGLAATVSTTCTAPSNINSTPGYYDEQRDLTHPNDSYDITGFKVPEKGLAMTDLLVAALACNSTRVGTMMWCDSEANVMLSFLKDANGAPMNDHHHAYQHDRGYQPDALEIINKWLATNFAYLLQKMDAVEDGGASMLDNSLVFWVSDIQHPGNHRQENMPFIVAGGAGGKVQTNRWMQIPSQSHNNLLTSFANLFGLTDAKFGDPNFCTGPLAGFA